MVTNDPLEGHLMKHQPIMLYYYLFLHIAFFLLKMTQTMITKDHLFPLILAYRSKYNDPLYKMLFASQCRLHRLYHQLLQSIHNQFST